MPLEKIVQYRCTICNRTYSNFCTECEYCKSLYVEGDYKYNFKIVKRLGKRRFLVECQLCGKEVGLSQVAISKGQKSCGCIPRNITIVDFNVREHTLKYLCAGCGQVNYTELPVKTWCCKR